MKSNIINHKTFKYYEIFLTYSNTACMASQSLQWTGTTVIDGII